MRPWSWAITWIGEPPQRVLVAAGVLGLLLSPHTLGAMQSTMWLHMGVQLPALAWVGWWATGAVSSGTLDRWHCINLEGVPCWLLWLAVTSVWMVPRSLDLAVTSSLWNFGKVMLWLMAGGALRIGWTRSSPLVRTFALGNSAWMGWVAGILYADSPDRLCNAYLQSDQRLAGAMVMGWALIATAVLLRTAMSWGGSPLAGHPAHPTRTLE